MNTHKSLLLEIIHRQLSFLGHVIRKYYLEGLVVTGFDDGKNARGRTRETFLTYLNKMMNKFEMIRMAKKKEVWSKWCAHSNLRLKI